MNNRVKSMFRLALAVLAALLLAACPMLLFVSCEVDGSIPSPEEPGSLEKYGLVILDPLFKEQWQIYNDGSKEGYKKGIDINLLPVWKKGYLGEGLSTGIVDNGFDPTHPDLKDNFYKHVPPKSPVEKCKSHGSQVMGIIGARDNRIGIRGIAPRARLYGYDYSDYYRRSPGDFLVNATDILTREESTLIAAWNFSFGPGNHQIYTLLTKGMSRNINATLDNGFAGRGSSLVVAAGNGKVSLVIDSEGRLFPVVGGVSSYNPLTNHYGVMGVNAITGNGEWAEASKGGWGHTVGTNIWITAPTRTKSTTNTTCKGQEDYSIIGGTSGAAPMVTGVVTLLRGAYPQLTWRDVKLILAESARKILPDKEGLIANGYLESGSMYHNPAKKQSYHRLSGFGLVDAGGAFEMAENWSLLPEEMEPETYTGGKTPLDTSDINKKYESTLKVSGSKIGFVESITLNMNIKSLTDSQPGSLTLRAPDGKVATFYDMGEVMFIRGDDDKGEDKDKQLLLLTNRFLGYGSPNGTWKLEINHSPGRQTVITEVSSWDIIVRGH